MSQSSQTVKNTPMNDIPQIVSSVRQAFSEGKTSSVEFRKNQLKQVYKMVNENSQRFIRSIQAHMSRPSNEIIFTEISVVLHEAAHLMNHLEKYMSPKKVASSAAFATDSGEIQYVPRGTVLIIGAWNFPLQLLFAPFVGAIAAGCTVILKPSEVAYEFANLVLELVPKYLDKDCYKIVNGGADETSCLIKNKFDLIFYTGGCQVGKIISKAASEYLTPVVLELGGKNPVVVDDTVDLSVVAKRIAWGRWALNCGQVCIAPEYILCPKHLQSRLIQELINAIHEFYGQDPQKSSDYARIVNDRHFQRLSSVLEENKSLIAYGGQTDAKTRYIAPTILNNVTNDSPIMKDEVFGPIISIFPVESTNNIIPIIQQREKSLAMYIFSKNKQFINEILKRTDSGGVTINDTLTHFSFPGFPFGGTGASGVGRYHGWYSFRAFSHEKPVLHKYAGGEYVNTIRNPPFTDNKVSIYRALTEEKPHSSLRKFIQDRPYPAMMGLGALIYYLQSKL